MTHLLIARPDAEVLDRQRRPYMRGRRDVSYGHARIRSVQLSPLHLQMSTIFMCAQHYETRA